MVFGEVCGCLVVCQGKAPPADDESSRYLEALARYVETTAQPRVLVITSGGAPNPEQRKKLDRITRQNRGQIKFAIVTGSTFARGVVKAIRLIHPFYQAFAPGEMDDALRFLDVRSADVLEVTGYAGELQASLTG